MHITDSTARYEEWLKTVTAILPEDLASKHQAMAGSPFEFLRATYYHWSPTVTDECPDLVATPVVPSIGDVHIENFGTWRDAEGRLAWGINDYDEAAFLPYTNDLLRVATSTLLAIESDHLRIRPKDACSAILKGYTRGIEKGPRIFVLAEKNDWLRDIARNELKDPDRFWSKLQAMPDVENDEAREIFARCLSVEFKLKRRTAGLGSLGRKRFVALATWNGALIAREAKAMVPPAQNAFGNEVSSIAANILATRAMSPDPFLVMDSQWCIRRLAPDCTRLELGVLEHAKDQTRLLTAMGREIANVQISDPNRTEAIRADISRRSERWLYDAADLLATAVAKQCKDWRKDLRKKDD
ncbi:MAG: DUF2252 family protein [Leptospirales bacterium]|nr:DUF2252 family protein [Leptospirales bacterium]